MKPSTLAARHTIQREHAIRIKPRLIAEWEYNRFLSPTVTVTPSQSGDATWAKYYGDSSTITKPARPVAGIAKARANDGMRPMGKYRDTPEATRYYPSGEDELYKYWSSLQRTELAPDASGYPFDVPISISLIYPQAIALNKIVIGFELGYCKPKNTSIQVTTNGIVWTTIANNPVIDGDGLVTIWSGQTGWDDIPDYDNPVVVTGVRLNVFSTDTAFSHLDVLQISPRLENDLSDYLIDYTSQFEISSPSFIAPMGKASSNQATVTLSNIDGRFNGQNLDSLYYGMIEKKVRFTMDLGVDTGNQGGAAGVYEYIREFTMWTDSWGAGNGGSSQVQVQLKDSSVILQEFTMPPIFLENATVGGIVAYTLDTIGMTNYVYTKGETDLGQLIPFYWPSDSAESSNPRWGRQKVSTQPAPNTTIWDELSALAEATQTGLYFDENDQLQIVARRSMYNNNKPVNWNLDAVPNGQKLPDVVSAASSFDLAANQVEVTYRSAAMSVDTNGFPVMATVWQPSADSSSTAAIPSVTDSSNATDVVLRASAMVKDLTTTGTSLWISQADAVVWPYESDVNIEGEVLHYLGKEYAYYDSTNVLKSQVVKSLTDQQNLDALNVFLSWKNSYTGRFVVTARGLYNSPVASHVVSSRANYSTTLTDLQQNPVQTVGDGFVSQRAGYITQYSPVIANVTPDWGGRYMLRRQNSAVVPVTKTNGDKVCWYGTRIRFPSGYSSAPTNPANPADQPELAVITANWHDGGLHFGGDNGGGGYYLEIVSTGQIDGWEQRGSRHEVSLYAIPGGSNGYQLSGNNYLSPSGKTDSGGTPIPTGAMGFQMGILEDQWYDVDVAYTEHSDGSIFIAVYIDGVVAGTWNLYASTSGATSNISLKAPPNHTNHWRFGTVVRGPSMGVDFEMLYAFAEDDSTKLHGPDVTNFLDLKTGGYASGWLSKNVMYGSSGHTNWIIDEYGPWVHELRTFDVQFNQQNIPAPASFLYLSNAAQVDCLSYFSDAFGAEFVLANANRGIAIVNGQDNVTAGADNTITQSMLIWGMPVYTAQNDSFLIERDENGIRRQGLIRTQFTSRYIQTDEMAGEIADWIISIWGTGVDEVDAVVFGNPLLQVGDLVTMNYPVQGMAPHTHQYFVIAVDNDFSAGYKTSLKLRRAKITGPVNPSV